MNTPQAQNPEVQKVLYLSKVRLSFPKLIEPQRSVNNGVERIRYGADLILHPQTHQADIAKFWQIVQLCATEKMKEHAGQVLQMISSDKKARCWAQGSEKVNAKTFRPYDGYVDAQGNPMLSISAGRETPPQIIDGQGKPIEPTNTMLYQQLARGMYGGCYVNVAIKPWFQMNNPEKGYGYGVRCDLIAVQFAGDGEAFGEAAPDVTGMFGQVAAASSGVATPAGAAFPGQFAAPAGSMPGAPFPVAGGIAAPTTAPQQPMPGAPFGGAPQQPMPGAPFGGAPQQLMPGAPFGGAPQQPMPGAPFGGAPQQPMPGWKPF